MNTMGEPWSPTPPHYGRFPGGAELWKQQKATDKHLQLQEQPVLASYPQDPSLLMASPPYTSYITTPARERFASTAAKQKFGSGIGHTRHVFDRLTDSMYFTGTHKERFDEFGHGRGLAGREYLFIHDGLTESPSRTHEVYSSVYKTPKKPIVTPGTLGVQRYGVQVAAPKLMWLFRNGDKHHDGVPYFVRAHVKNLNCLYYEISKKITPINGPIRKIYDQTLKPIRSLEEILDGAKYLCSSGEPPAQLERLEKFLNHWVVQKPQSKVQSHFFLT